VNAAPLTAHAPGLWVTTTNGGALRADQIIHIDVIHDTGTPPPPGILAGVFGRHPRHWWHLTATTPTTHHEPYHIAHGTNPHQGKYALRLLHANLEQYSHYDGHLTYRRGPGTWRFTPNRIIRGVPR
jgi:hypothetical protein